MKDIGTYNIILRAQLTGQKVREKKKYIRVYEESSRTYTVMKRRRTGWHVLNEKSIASSFNGSRSMARPHPEEQIRRRKSNR